MNIIETKLEELTNSELAEITGGGLLYDLGAGAHHFVNYLARHTGQWY